MASLVLSCSEGKCSIAKYNSKFRADYCRPQKYGARGFKSRPYLIKLCYLTRLSMSNNTVYCVPVAGWGCEYPQNADYGL